MPSIKSFVASLILAGNACAQYGYGGGGDAASSMSTTSTDSSSTPTPALTAAGTTVHVIKASNKNGDLTFSPNSISANAGDMVQWQFYPKNHSVVMASFAQPCVPIEQSAPENATNAFFSGFMPVSDVANGGMLTYTIMVKDTKPMWYYCSQGKHCQAGMVGVINPPANSAKTIDAFAASAKNAPENISPSESDASGTASGTGSSGTSYTMPGATDTSSTSPGVAQVTTSGASLDHTVRNALVTLVVAAIAVSIMS